MYKPNLVFTKNDDYEFCNVPCINLYDIDDFTEDMVGELMFCYSYHTVSYLIVTDGYGHHHFFICNKKYRGVEIDFLATFYSIEFALRTVMNF